MSVTVFGSINVDLVTRVAELPRAGETVAATSFARLPGGKGANQAVACARYGAPTRLIGAVGDDADGAAMCAGLEREGIDVAGIACLPRPTGMAFVTVSAAGENQITIVAGANAALTAPDVLDWRGQVVALAQLEVSIDAVAAVFASARAAGVRTILNTAPARPEAAELLAAADIVILNETELGVYLGSAPPEGAEAVATAARRLRRPGQWIVVTLGAAGIVAVSEDTTLAVAAPRVEAVDTTGAGDTFCGVLAACLAEGAAMEPALRTACVAASLSVRRAGAQAAMPTRVEVEAAA